MLSSYLGGHQAQTDMQTKYTIPPVKINKSLKTSKQTNKKKKSSFPVPAKSFLALRNSLEVSYQPEG